MVDVHISSRTELASVPAVTRGRDRRRWLLTVPAVVFAVIVVGGYGLRWRWTGMSGGVTLWDWLEALALPVAVAVAPLLLRHRRRLTRRHHCVLGAVLLGFSALVLAGYLVPLNWTGFVGNTLWDWLQLALLPVAIATASLWPGWDTLGRRHYAAAGLVGAALSLVIVFGYAVPWRWTGFADNTAWDWIKLLLVPVLVPIVVLPFVTERLTSRLAPAADSTAGPAPEPPTVASGTWTPPTDR